MESTVDFLMVTTLNQMLKDRGIEYSLHTVGGCSCCGLHLRCDGKQHDEQDILNIINDYLSSKWLVASFQVGNHSMIYVDSKFEKLERGE